MLDPRIGKALVPPVQFAWALEPDDERLLQLIAEGLSMKAIAVSYQTRATNVAAPVEKPTSHGMED